MSKELPAYRSGVDAIVGAMEEGSVSAVTPPVEVLHGEGGVVDLRNAGPPCVGPATGLARSSLEGEDEGARGRLPLPFTLGILPGRLSVGIVAPLRGFTALLSIGPLAIPEDLPSVPPIILRWPNSLLTVER
mmetsp:Transcript_2373/g.4092  ORF Transcript_2373/g.4092 Transcript_2373/m.4092 type:complete len:132 (-) Transcript_2373:155-550(-)|eukprot:CAMPEP_0184683562 /NCGR_PEP_ID=MMETSP0312-20130426/11796_1 /TAXON_ID=31354 /ORGANISM="Compsopogon coeruleus, Strain SAG 36.94" /LENGTH=131 /DNA_ID=CAMNT_0027136007 /DNA_START=429 /DNA_END=824 /DNA_ORIENTATION=-